MSPPVSKTVCGKCKLLVKGRAFLLCIQCNLHFHIECKGYEKRFYLLDAERKAEWKCDVCRRKNYLNKNKIDTPVKTPMASAGSSKTLNNKKSTTISESNHMAIPPSPDTCDDNDEVDDPFLNVTLRKNASKGRSVCPDDDVQSSNRDSLDITTSLKEYIADVMTTFTENILKKIDDIALSLNDFNHRCSLIESKVTSLEERFDESIEKRFNELTQRIDQLSSELNDKDQEMLTNEIELSGIPEENGENPIHLMTLVATKLGVKITDADVVSAIRVGARRDSEYSARAANPAPSHSTTSTVRTPATSKDVADTTARPLVVRLARRTLKDEVLRAARVRRGADTAGLGLSTSCPRRFYVNERLTRFNRYLFRRAREEARRLKWRFVWTRDGGIFVRREHGEPAIRIRTEDDLCKVFGVQKVGGL